MSTRYEAMFGRLAEAGQGAFVPFAVLGDPDAETSFQILEAMVRGGADALELGIAFSDPLADGPTLQAAARRALEAGVRTRGAFEMVRRLRERHPELPLGLLVYANLVEAQGREAFYRRASAAGVDSVLVADVPTLEARPYVEAAQLAGVEPVLIAAPNSAPGHLRDVARLSGGYTYVVTRAGVTGADAEARTAHRRLIEALLSEGAPPCLLGFGISRPEHVRAALGAGAAGAISGSAVALRIEQGLADVPALLAGLAGLVGEMKAATLPPPL
jgi:tryptophan synthase alpha chain